MPRPSPISGKPSLFVSPAASALIVACIAIVIFGAMPPLLGRTASFTLGNRATIMTAFGCFDAAWTSWPAASRPTWVAAEADCSRTRPGLMTWLPALRASGLETGPRHRIVSVPFWLVLIPVAALAGVATRRATRR